LDRRSTLWTHEVLHTHRKKGIGLAPVSALCGDAARRTGCPARTGGPESLSEHYEHFGADEEGWKDIYNIERNLRHQVKENLIPTFNFSHDLDVALSLEQVGDDTQHHRLIICQ